MEQGAVISFLTLTDLRTSAIAAELKSVYKIEALAFSTVKKWRKRFAEGRTSLHGDPRCERPLANDAAEALFFMLKETPYLSCKVLCRYFRNAKGTCLRILHDTLGRKKFHLHWVSHALDTNQKVERVTLSHGIPSVLQTFL
jgi:hypothetical protein